jgi:hypothetical protein
MFREDILQSNGTFKRVRRCVLLGLVSSMSNRAAWKSFQPYLDRVNVAAKMPPKSGVTLESFVKEWRTNVAVNLKGSTTRAAESHLRAHILPKLGSLTLPEINTKPVQSFGVSRNRTVTQDGRKCAAHSFLNPQNSACARTLTRHAVASSGEVSGQQRRRSHAVPVGRTAAQAPSDS